MMTSIFSLNIPVYLWPWLAGLLGLCIGSLLNVIIYRLPLTLHQAQCHSPLGATEEHNNSTSTSINLFLPRSHCPKCSHTIAWYDNIPVLSWLLLRGHCRHCFHPISWQYPLIEIATSLCAIALALYYPPDLNWLLFMLFFSLLLSLSLIDYYYQLLPDNLTYSLLWCGLIWHCLNQPNTLPDAVAGAIIGYLFLWCLYWIFRLVRNKEGLGYGDFKLLAALGAWCGWQKLPEILLVAALISIIGMLFFKRNDTEKWHKSLPFGPGLAIAGGWTMIAPLLLS